MTQHETAWIYALTEPVGNDVRYVGVTSNVRKRFSCHLSSKCGYAKAKELSLWIHGLLDKRSSPGLMVLEEVSFVDRYDREKWWIDEMKSRGCRLINTVHVKLPPQGADALLPRSLAGKIRAVLDENGWDTPSAMIQEVLGPQIHHFNYCNMVKERGRWVTVFPGKPHPVPIAYINSVKYKFRKFAGHFSQ